VGVKLCSKCGVNPARAEDQSYCNPCNTSYLRDWKKEHPATSNERKLCTECKVNQRRFTLRATNCLQCHAKRQKEYYRQNPNKQRDGQLKAHYGINLQEYNRLYDEQGGRCLICEVEAPKGQLAVDHDHNTSQVRGLLCMRCNKGLGFFRDDVAFLLRAVDYLMRICENA